MSFPLPSIPHADYHPPPNALHQARGRFFGANRDAGRLHAGCDLLSKPGTPVLAVRRGVVVRKPIQFYHCKNGNWTYGIEVKHDNGLIVRYGEVGKAVHDLQAGQIVEEGETIGHVGDAQMLHFELYAGTERGELSNKRNKGFERRPDLMDPTEFLDSLRTQLYCKMAIAR